MTPAFMPLETDRLRLRRWQEEDRDLFCEINRDPKVMEFFPFRRSRAEADALMDLLNRMIDATGLGFYALEAKAERDVIGFCGLAETKLPGILPDGTVEIGWRLATRFWGQGFVTEAARACLDYAFSQVCLRDVVAFAVHTNRRSIAVMERIGMTEDGNGAFDHPGVPESHPQLKRHVLYRITATEWTASRTV